MSNHPNPRGMRARVSRRRIEGVFGVAGLVFAVGCDLSVPASSTSGDQIRSVVTMEGVHLIRFEEGRPRVVATLDSVVIDRERGMLRATGVAVRTTRGSNARTSSVSLRSPAAESDLDGSRVTFEGGVLVEDVEGTKIRSEKLVYSRAEQTLSAPGEVRMEGSNFVGVGPSMVGHIQAEQIHIPGPAQLRTYPVE